MTCIVAVKGNGKVYMGGDSCGAAGGSWDKINVASPKVFVNRKIAIGYTCSFRMGQLLQYKFTPPDKGQTSLIEYMVTDFVDELRRCFSANGFAKIDNGVEEGGTFLVGMFDSIFRISEDYQVTEVLEDFDSVGCGDMIAKGSLYTTAEFDISPEERIQLALKAAENFSAAVNKPFHTVKV